GNLVMIPAKAGIHPAAALPAFAGITKVFERGCNAPDLLDRLLHDRRGCRLRAAVSHRARRAAWAIAATPMVRLHQPRRRLRAGGRRPILLRLSPRAAGAGVARLLAVALVLALARGRSVSCDLRAGGDLR